VPSFHESKKSIRSSIKQKEKIKNTVLTIDYIQINNVINKWIKMDHMFSNISSYEQLRERLTNWVNFREDVGCYDFSGILDLFLACLDNMQKNNIMEGQYELFGEVLTKEQIFFLEEIIKSTKSINTDA
jgi:hypothetical protein